MEIRGIRRVGRRSGRSSRRAFSLLELMLVIVILGVLMSVAAYNVIGMGERAKVRATKTSMATIDSAIKNYHLEKSVYPTAINDLVVAQFLEAGKTKDGWKSEFFYTVTNSDPARPYQLVSPGGDKDITTPGDNIDVWTMNEED